MKMTQIWKDETIIPVTVIKAEPNTVSFMRTMERDGYEAAQLAMGKKVKREFRKKNLTTLEGMEKGKKVTVESFVEGDKVRVSGLAKGRGFQGGVKRHGFHGGPKTHGQKNRFRAPGSIGNTSPQRVIPGRKMAGHMGTNRVTLKNLEVVAISKENNTIMIRGAVPGAIGTLIEIERIKNAKK